MNAWFSSGQFLVLFIIDEAYVESSCFHPEMPIPPLDKRGLLPPGVHDCTLDEIETAFSRADAVHKRAVLFGRFRAFVTWTQSLNWVKLVYVDGSFVTDKELPGDIDVTIELPAASPDVAKTFLNSAVFNRNLMKQNYSVDVLPTTAAQDFRDFFQSLKPGEAYKRGLRPDTVKGILRLTL